MLPEVGFQKKISAYTEYPGKRNKLLDADTYSVSPAKVPAHATVYTVEVSSKGISGYQGRDSSAY